MTSEMCQKVASLDLRTIFATCSMTMATLNDKKREKNFLFSNFFGHKAMKLDSDYEGKNLYRSILNLLSHKGDHMKEVYFKFFFKCNFVL